MTQDRDHYEDYYANKLWDLLPAVYRSLDTDKFNSFGPLRELVNRIGAQAAILRRSIDRTWQDQSIETCDDWVIPYIGDLLATNLVASLDAAGQRRDVAKTIYYRRRKGTVAVLEEIAADITGWDAKVVEFFRRLARTRHGLDPAIGRALRAGDATGQLQMAEGLIGPLTRTPIGGTARLGKVYGASKTRSAFDEFFHTADFRYGQGQIGWHNIPRLGVFLWRLMSFETGPVTPVAVRGCPGWFTFDPTGRDIPLFALSSRDSDYYATQWVSPVEAQLPTPISQALFDAEASLAPKSPPDSPPADTQSAENLTSLLYPNALAVYPTPTPQSTLEALLPCSVVVRPERGRVEVPGSPPAQVWLKYAYGFSDRMGAGPYDRRLVRANPAQPGTPSGVGRGLPFTIPTAGTFSFGDSLTYNTPNDVLLTNDLTIMAADEQRPLLRFVPEMNGWTEWTITGCGGKLALDGLFVSGADIVLAGNFTSVTITCCTFDPGTAAAEGAEAPLAGPLLSPPASGMFANSADGRELTPCRLWIEGSIETLTIQRSVLGPIRTRGAGEVDTLSVSDSVLQGIPTATGGSFAAKDIKDPALLEQVLRSADDPISAYLKLESPLAQWEDSPISSPPAGATLSPAALVALVNALNDLANGPPLYQKRAFAGVPLSSKTQQLRTQVLANPALLPELNRSLLEDAYPLELADAALAIRDGTVSLSRCTVLDRISVHRLEASECILNDLAVVDDTQHGCVRFTCWTIHSVLPRQFESVRTNPRANLFTSTEFGQPGYGQLLQTADARILPSQGEPASSAAPPTILRGAENGSEMGAFCLAQNSIKQQALLIKYEEYMPFGLVPVLIFVT